MRWSSDWPSGDLSDFDPDWPAERKAFEAGSDESDGTDWQDEHDAYLMWREAGESAEAESPSRSSWYERAQSEHHRMRARRERRRLHAQQHYRRARRAAHRALARQWQRLVKTGALAQEEEYWESQLDEMLIGGRATPQLRHRYG